MIALLALLATPASACSPEEPCAEHAEATVGAAVIVAVDRGSEDEDEATEDDGDDCGRRRCRETDPGYATLRVDGIPLRNHTAWGIGLRGHGKHDNWLFVEGRWATDGLWMGRFGAGVDIFGKSPFDLGIGIVGGHVGDWQSESNRRFAVSTELLIGWRPGRFLFEHRHMGGKRPEGRGIRTESHTLLGYRILPRLELAADFTTIDPGFNRDGWLVQGEHGVGLVVGLRF